LKNAEKRNSAIGRVWIPKLPDNLKGGVQQPRLKQAPTQKPFNPDSQMLDKIEKQMEKLQDRIKELEKNQSDLLDRLSKQQDKQKTGQINSL
jgi:hypothetical protein